MIAVTANGVEVEFTVWGPLTRQDVPAVCERLGEQLAREDVAGVGVVMVDAEHLAQCDAVAMEVLARLRLTAGPRPVCFRNVPAGLRELMEWVGLVHLLDGSGDSGAGGSGSDGSDGGTG